MKLLSIHNGLKRYGAENHMLRVAVGAARRGVEVHAAFPSTAGTASMVRDCALGGVRYQPFDPDAPLGPLAGGSRPARILQIIRLLNAVRPNVVQLTMGLQGEAPMLVTPCALVGVPTLVVFQWASEPWRPSGIQLWACRWARARRQRWAAVSRQNLGVLQQTFQMREDELDLLYNGVEIAPDTDSTDGAETETLRRALRDELGLPHTARLLLTVARLVPEKGHADLLRAAQGLIGSHPDIRFVWAGDGEEQERLTSLIRQLRLEQHVRVLGYRTDISRLLRASDLFVYPSHGEGGCSSSIREAMVYRVPIVASRAGGIPEVLRDRLEALLFDVGDCEQMQARISEALRAPSVMRRLADHARKRIEEFSAERMIDQYMAVFDALCRDRGVDPRNPYPAGARP